MFISLRSSISVMGSNVNLGSFGVTGVKRSNSIKTLKFVHVIQHGHKTHTCSSALDLLSMLWGQMSIWGHFRRQTTPSLMANISSRFFFFLSFFWQHFRDLYLRYAWTDFNQTWSQEPLTHGIYVI